MKTNSVPSSHPWNRWLIKQLDRAIAARLDQLEEQVQTYQQENLDLKQRLKADQAQLQALTEQVNRLERYLQVALESTGSPQTGSTLSQVDRQLSRIWQYYQDAKVQFEQIKRQLQQQRTTTEESTQKLRQQINALSDRQRAEVRDLKQQFDQLAFKLQPHRSPPEDIQPLEDVQ